MVIIHSDIGVLFTDITASGADAFLLHITTAPSVAYVVRDFPVYQILRWDADRCIAVDENGMEVHRDYIQYVCGKYLKECGRLQNNTVVATIMSNMGLFKAMKREGIEVCVTTVGDKYVNEAMVANGYVLGGERYGAGDSCDG